jgi:hypothetical protein
MKIHVLLLRDETDMKRVGCRVVAKAYGSWSHLSGSH